MEYKVLLKTAGAFAVLIAVIGGSTGCGDLGQAGTIPVIATTTPTPSAAPSGTPSATPSRTPTLHAKPKKAKRKRIPAPAAAPVSRRASPAAPPAPSSPAHASCYPLTNGGNCYEPGEFCRIRDRGTSGIAGDGEAITCEDNDGWRWEPS